MLDKSIVVITGKLASGKSTLAKSLSMDLEIPCYIKDIYKEQLVDQYGFANREENRALSVKAVNIMLELAECDMKNNSSLILEANFRKDEIERIYALANKYGYKISLFLLTGNDEILYKRFLLRVPTRHIAHLSQGFDKDYDSFVNYNNNLTLEVSSFIHHDIDTSKINSDEALNITKGLLSK